MRKIIESINILTHTVDELPHTDAPLETMVARGIERGKYDRTLQIRQSLQKVVGFVRPLANDAAAAAALAELPQSISDQTVHDLQKLSAIAKEVPIKCQRQTTSAVPHSYNGQEAAAVQICTASLFTKARGPKIQCESIRKHVLNLNARGHQCLGRMVSITD